MRRFIWALLGIAGFVSALHLFIILFTDGYTVPLLAVRADDPSRPLMVLLTVTLLSLILGGRGSVPRPDWNYAAILATIMLMIYLANGQICECGDTRPNRYLPLSLLRFRTFYLDSFPNLYAVDPQFRNTPGSSKPYFLSAVGSHYVSVYTIGAALMALPFYVPSAMGQVRYDSPLIAWLEKLSAATIMALAVGVLFLALRQRTRLKMAFLVSVAYGLGSSSFSVSSQGLYQHGPGQLALATAILALIKSRDEPSWIPVAGFALGFAVVCRPILVLMAAPLTLYVLLHHRREFMRFLLAALLWGLFQLCYNATYLGDPLRWPLGPPRHLRGATTQKTIGVLSEKAFISPASPVWKNSWPDGLVGLTFSPGRGLFIYSPIFLLSGFGIALAWKKGGDPLLRWCSLGVLLIVALLSNFDGWYGGHCYGPRLLADIGAPLALCLAPLEDWLQRSRAMKRVFWICLVWSVGAHAIGVFCPDTWNVDVDVEWYPEAVWSWSNNQLVNPVRLQFDQLRLTVSGVPTTRAFPQGISACYHGCLYPKSVPAGFRRLLAVDTVNLGRSVWLAGGGEHGRVKLGWRWWRADGSAYPLEGRAGLGHDVFPGQRYEFRTRVISPGEPGQYGVEVGLVIDGVGWFSEAGVPPLRFVETVTPASPP